MSLEGNKAIARRHVEEVWNQGNVELIDQIYATESSSVERDRPQNLKDRVRWWHMVCPGIRWTTLNMVAEGDTVMIHWRVNVEYTVVLDPPPATPFLPYGKPVSFEGVDVLHIEGGKIVSMEHI